MKRAFDILVSLALGVATAPLWFAVAVAVRSASPGPILHRSKRVGRDGSLFTMYKFRTMRAGTPQLASHLLANPSQHLAPGGAFLRRASLDELPQLLNVLRGDMSLVGPRPALFNQENLIAAREAAGVASLLPGITGWAQINGRDELGVDEKVALDAEYAARRGFTFDARILFLTAWRAVRGHGVSH